MQPTPKVARSLLGKALVVGTSGGLAAEIVEVEAYLGEKDPASHAFPGPTKRNWPMFEEGGTCYVYLSYGVHFCMNVATGPKGRGEAVLFRAVAPLEGEQKMLRNRKIRPEKRYLISNGPGKLTQALRIDLRYNGMRFDRKDFKLVDFGKAYKRVEIASSPRIGISKAKELPLRFYVSDCPWVSRKG